jgi:hypothetical protein
VTSSHWFSQQGATKTENEGKINRGQYFSMKFQALRVNMDHPMTQRTKNQPKERNPKDKNEANTKR